ncbi:hypothetical protein Tco_0693185 [Tanacetum coccineum]
MVNIIRKVRSLRSIFPTNVLIATVQASRETSTSSALREVETIHNMTAENKLYFQAEKEAIFLILTGIGDEIYSTVDACNTSKEMWTAIERLQRGEFAELYVQFLHNFKPECVKICDIVKQSQESSTVLISQVFDVLKQFQNEVNDSV